MYLLEKKTQSDIEQLERLLDRSFDRGPATQANQLIQKTRERFIREIGQGINYEVVLTGRFWEYITHTVAPRLVLYLNSKRLDIFDCPQVFISLFWSDTIYFIRTRDLLELVRLSDDLGPEEFREVAHLWARTGRRTAGLLPA